MKTGVANPQSSYVLADGSRVSCELMARNLVGILRIASCYSPDEAMTALRLSEKLGLRRQGATRTSPHVRGIRKKALELGYPIGSCSRGFYQMSKVEHLDATIEWVTRGQQKTLALLEKLRGQI